MKGKGGFTIVELMVSVGIIAVLLTIVVVAAKGALGSTRAKRTEAMKTALEQGIAAYYAQLGEWPRAIEARIDSITGNTYVFTEGETDEIFREVIGKAYGAGSGAKVALIDATALFVAKTAGLRNATWPCAHCGQGYDLSELQPKGGGIQGVLGQLSFGYPCTDHGLFCRFWIKYNVKSDAVSVLLSRE